MSSGTYCNPCLLRCRHTHTNYYYHKWLRGINKPQQMWTLSATHLRHTLRQKQRQTYSVAAQCKRWFVLVSNSWKKGNIRSWSLSLSLSLSLSPPLTCYAYAPCTCKYMHRQHQIMYFNLKHTICLKYEFLHIYVHLLGRDWTVPGATTCSYS